MLSLVTAAEHQYRHDTWARDRELARLASIRERRAPEPVVLAPAPQRETPRRRPAVWARPIGQHASAECSAVACATA